MRRTISHVLAILIVVLAPTPSSAVSLTFEYLGQPFTEYWGGLYGEGDRLSASITFDSSLLDPNGTGFVCSNKTDCQNPLVTDFWINDGHRTFDVEDATADGGFTLWLSEYQVEHWSFAISVGCCTSNMRSLNDPDFGGNGTEDASYGGPGPNSAGSVTPFVPGTWAFVPEPSTAFLLVLGLAALTTRKGR